MKRLARLVARMQSKRDLSSRKALLWMTAKSGFMGRTETLEEADRLTGGRRIKDLTQRARKKAGGRGDFGRASRIGDGGLFLEIRSL